MGQISHAFDHIIDKKEIQELSVVLYTDSFFCGYWNASGQLMKCESFPIKKFEQFVNAASADLGNVSLKILSTTIPYVHVPQRAFNAKHYEDYFIGLYDVRKAKRKNKEMDFWAGIPINTLHYLDHQIVSIISDSELPFKINHISTSMSNHMSLFPSDLLVVVQGSRLHISCHKDGNFVFYNQFICADINDYIYFILLILQSFQLPYSSSEVHIGGELDRTSKLYSRLRAHVPKLKVIDDVIETQHSLENPKQIYFDLYLSQACVS